VQLWLGHHSPAFTLATYVHLLADDLPVIDLLEGGKKVGTRPTETRRDAAETGDAETADLRVVSS
jgi:hypothetical protein